MRTATIQATFAALAFLIVQPLMAEPDPGTAAGYPNRSVRFVVPYGPGTSTDLQARFMAQKFGELTRQSVVVENKPGANAILGTQFALNAPADGYTLVVGGTTSHAGNKSLFKNLPYDPIKDFVAISGVAIGGGAFIVSPNFPARSMPELVALARRDPDKYSYGWASAFSRIAVENLLFETGIKMLHVPYKGSASLASEVMAGTVDLAFEPIVTLLPLIRSGKVHSLGVSTMKRAPGLDDVPSIAEQGVPNYQFLGWLCIFAKAGTSAPIVDRLNELFVSILKTPEAADFFRQNAVWEPMIMTPSETARFVASEVELWKQGVERAGIEPQ